MIKTEKQVIAEEELMRLFSEYQETKNKILKNKIILKNQPLVTYIVNKYYAAKLQQHSVRDDLLQEGSIGLMSAVDGFDPHRGYKFSTYACVPLSTEILTKRGWKKYNEIIDGDETLGYNNGKSEWTKIEGAQTYDETTPLVKFGDSMWNVICTNQHKWLISENNEVKLRPLTEWPSSKKY